MTPAILSVTPTAAGSDAEDEDRGLVILWFRPPMDMVLLCVPLAGPLLERLSPWEFVIRAIARSCKAAALKAGLDGWQLLLRKAMRAVCRGEL
jgi:hypothetical protein